MRKQYDLRLPAKQAWQGSEHELQKRIMLRCSIIRGMYPSIELLHAIPNGGARNVIVATKLKAEGVKGGVPDLFLPVLAPNFSGLYIELKNAGGSLSENQHWWLSRLSNQGFLCVVTNSEAETMDIIEGYLCGKVESVLEFQRGGLSR